MNAFLRQSIRTNKHACVWPVGSTSRGFTLTEVLMSIAILLLIIGASIGGFTRYAHTQSYRATIDQVRNNLTVMRQKTLASYDDTVYGIYVGTSSIEFFRGATPVVGSPDNEIISFAEQGITATSSFSNNAWFITFSRISGEATATGTITIDSSRTTSSTTLTIYASGLVE